MFLQYSNLNLVPQLQSCLEASVNFQRNLYSVVVSKHSGAGCCSVVVEKSTGFGC